MTKEQWVTFNSTHLGETFKVSDKLMGSLRSAQDIRDLLTRQHPMVVPPDSHFKIKAGSLGFVPLDVFEDVGLVRDDAVIEVAVYPPEREPPSYSDVHQSVLGMSNALTQLPHHIYNLLCFFCMTIVPYEGRSALQDSPFSLSPDSQNEEECSALLPNRSRPLRRRKHSRSRLE